MGLTSEKSLIEVNKLYNLCFEANALCDRMSYVLSIKYNMIDFGDWFHHHIAHYFPSDALADGIESYGELRGDLFYRGMIPEQNQDWSLVSFAMKDFVMKVAEIEKQCVLALHTCADNGDEGYEDFLRDLNIKNISPLMKQATVFYDAIKSYEMANDIHKWNKDYKAWIIPQFKGDD